jgi:hypothetical protein
LWKEVAAMLPLQRNRSVFTLLLFCSSFLGGGSALADEADTIGDALSARYFPMKVGYKWVYAFNDKDVTFEVLRAEKSRASTLYVIRRSFEKHQVEYKLAIGESGVYIHQEGKKVFSPPLRQFAFLPRTGDVWKWRGTADGKRVAREFQHRGMEKVKVPAGSYSAISVHEEEKGGDHATFWLAEGVGVVRLSGKSELFGGNRVVFEWKLKRFQKGKE